MRALTAILSFSAVLAAAPAFAQSVDLGGGGGSVPGGPPQPAWDGGSRYSALDGRDSGILATSPSRMSRSRRTMNEGREPVWAGRLTPAQVRASAEEGIDRAGYECTIADFKLVAELRDGTPVVEVACNETGGLILANMAENVAAADCLDIVQGVGEFEPCSLPANVAVVAAARN